MMVTLSYGFDFIFYIIYGINLYKTRKKRCKCKIKLTKKANVICYYV